MTDDPKAESNSQLEAYFRWQTRKTVQFQRKQAANIPERDHKASAPFQGRDAKEKDSHGWQSWRILKSAHNTE